MKLKKRLIGSTVQITWINSGQTPSDIHCAVYNGSETLVDSATMVESGSGAGHYYHLFTIPNSGQQFYVAEILATIGGNPYKNRTKFKATEGEVD